ncbi:MAG TPA: hypothetical protein VLI69_08075 [Gammaproteobacteria bacterium]|nr:hypothetical protein [Gammaproteobacteria bacterium]
MLEKQRIFLFLFYWVITSIVLLPLLFNNTLPPIIDVLNHLIGIMQAKTALTAGEFPLRVTPSAHMSGWPYPYFQFYSPTSYMIAGGLFKWLQLNNPYTAYKMCIGLALWFAGIYMYRLVYWLTQSPGTALLSGAVYLLAPYCTVLIYYVGAFNEMLAVGALPAVVYYTLQQYYRGEMKTFLLSSFSWYLLLTIHLITFLCTSFFVGIGLVLMTIMITKKIKMPVRALAAYLFAYCLAMWHFAPIVQFSKFFIINQSFFFVKLYKVFLSTLLSPVLTLSSSSQPGIITDSLLEINPTMGVVFAFSAVLGTYLLIKKSLSEKNLNQILLILLILFFLVFVLIWIPSDFWWRWPVTMLQYSWRLLSQIMWIGTLLFALGINWLFSGSFNKKQLALILLLLFAVSAIWAPLFDVKYKTQGKIDELQHFSSDNYLLSAKKNSSLMNSMENLKLFYRKNPIKEGPPVIDLPENLLRAAFKPLVTVAGNVIEIKESHAAQFVARFNGEKIAIYPIKKGKFLWTFPLKNSSEKNLSTLQIAIEPQKNQKYFTFQINHTSLSGFFDPKKIVNISETRHSCHYINDETLCHINVPASSNFIELPIFYYPNMLNILVNGKPVSYISVLYHDALITGITPEAGKENVIQVKFVGFLWANFVSSLAWGVFLLLSLYLILNLIFYKKYKLYLEI